MMHVVDHEAGRGPFGARFHPLKRTPGAAAVAPSSHCVRWVSGQPVAHVGDVGDEVVDGVGGGVDVDLGLVHGVILAHVRWKVGLRQRVGVGGLGGARLD